MGKKKRPAPVPSEFSVQHAGGSSEFSKFISKDKVQTDVIEVPPGRFPVCPICLARDPDSDEHLPPGSLGGTAMTSTCTPCNNGFGTAEEELRRYLELEVRVRAESTTTGPVRGRRSATVALRSTPGRPAGAFVKTAAPDFHELIGSGPSQLRIEALDMNLVRAAALKQAYLAACLVLREVPTSADVERARKVLLAARDRDVSTLGEALVEFTVEAPGWIEVERAAPVLLIEPSEAVPGWLFAFAGRFTMPWPFADIQLTLEGDASEAAGGSAGLGGV